MTLFVVVAHTPMASALLAGVAHVFPEAKEILTYDILPDQDPEKTVEQLCADVKQTLEEDKQVLFFTDLIGSTPSNISVRAIQHLHQRGVAADLVSGSNLCMLLTAFRHRSETLEIIQSKVVEAGKRGILAVDCAAPNNVCS